MTTNEQVFSEGRQSGWFDGLMVDSFGGDWQRSVGGKAKLKYNKDSITKTKKYCSFEWIDPLHFVAYTNENKVLVTACTSSTSTIGWNGQENPKSGSKKQTNKLLMRIRTRTDHKRHKPLPACNTSSLPEMKENNFPWAVRHISSVSWNASLNDLD